MENVHSNVEPDDYAAVDAYRAGLTGEVGHG